jgi:hypothetical protein
MTPSSLMAVARESQPGEPRWVIGEAAKASDPAVAISTSAAAVRTIAPAEQDLDDVRRVDQHCNARILDYRSPLTHTRHVRTRYKFGHVWPYSTIVRNPSIRVTAILESSVFIPELPRWTPKNANE